MSKTRNLDSYKSSGRPGRSEKPKKNKNHSEVRYRKPDMEYYKSRGEYILVPKTRRLNWDEVTKLDSALSKTKGKKLRFGIESGKLINTIDHVGESFDQQNITNLEPSLLSNIKTRNALNGNSKVGKRTKLLLDQLMQRQNNNENLAYNDFNESTDQVKYLSSFYDNKLKKPVNQLKKPHLNNFIPNSSPQTIEARGMCLLC